MAAHAQGEAEDAVLEMSDELHERFATASERAPRELFRRLRRHRRAATISRGASVASLGIRWQAGAAGGLVWSVLRWPFLFHSFL